MHYEVDYRRDAHDGWRTFSDRWNYAAAIKHEAAAEAVAVWLGCASTDAGGRGYDTRVMSVDDQGNRTPVDLA